MSYQQSSFSNTMARARFRQRQYSWSDPAQIAANQQGIITQEQRNMLDKGLGCPYILVFVLFIFSCITVVTVVVAVIYQIFAGNSMVLINYPLGLITPCVLTLVLGVILSVLRQAHKNRFTSDIDALSIEHVQGEVIWENAQYVARTPGFRLTTTSKSRELPPPGPYHFYYVPGQKILLSAQPIHTYTQAFAQPGTLAATGLPGDEQARQAVQMALCSTLDFSLSDLDTNRLGMLTDRQRRKLSIGTFWRIVGSFIGLLISGGSLIIGIVSFLQGWITYGSMNIIVFFLILGFAGLILLNIFVICLRYLIVGARKRSIAIQYEPVQKIEGNIKVRVVDGGDSADSYYYDIRQLSFEVTEAAVKALISGVPYRIYYLASLKTLVSVEPLAAPAR